MHEYILIYAYIYMKKLLVLVIVNFHVTMYIGWNMRMYIHTVMPDFNKNDSKKQASKVKITSISYFPSSGYRQWSILADLLH